MKSLSTTSVKKYYFVKDEIIFDIKDYYGGLDSCAIAAGGDAIVKTPYIQVTSDDGTKEVVEKYYLEPLIEDGDKLIDNSGNKIFKKTVHDETSEKEKYFDAYYKDLCEKQIEKAVLQYNEQPFEWFKKNKNRLGVPLFMLITTVADDGVKYTTVGSNTVSGLQIDFTEEYFEDAKKKAVKDAIKNYGNTTADYYGYKVNNLDNITIEDKSE